MIGSAAVASQDARRSHVDFLRYRNDSVIITVNKKGAAGHSAPNCYSQEVNQMSSDDGIVSNRTPISQLPQVPGVYVIAYREIPDLYKIGVSNGLSRRIKGLSTSMPFDPIVLHLIPCPCPFVARYLEKALHVYLEPQRYKGEWFKLTSSELDQVCSIPSLAESGEHFISDCTIALSSMFGRMCFLDDIRGQFISAYGGEAALQASYDRMQNPDPDLGQWILAEPFTPGTNRPWEYLHDGIFDGLFSDGLVSREAHSEVTDEDDPDEIRKIYKYQITPVGIGALRACKYRQHQKQSLSFTRKKGHGGRRKGSSTKRGVNGSH